MVGDKIYVIGGYFVKDNKSHVLASNECYDPETDTWTVLRPMSRPRSGAAAVVVGNKIYVIGGVDESQSFVALNECYDPKTDKWRTLAPMPTARAVPAAVAVGNKIYCVGGETAWDKSSCCGPKYLSLNEEYDIATNKWRARKPMLSARPRPVAEAYEGKIYCIGGGELNRSLISGNNESYDPASDAWRMKYPMPTRRSAAAIAVLGDKIYVLGGYRMESGISKFPGKMVFLAANEAYDPKRNVWVMRLAMPQARAGMVAGVVKNKIYCIGGYGEQAGYLNLNEEYTYTGGAQ